MSYLERDPLGIYRNTSGDAGPGPTLMGADTLIGDNVCNYSEESLGDIKEIMLDMRNGEVAYAVLSFGGILGMGEKLFAVPWQRLTLDTANKRFLLDIPKDQLKNAPGFDKDDWPNMTSSDWMSEIDTFYGSGAGMGGARTSGPGNIAG